MDSQIASLERRLKQMENRPNQRSRSPRGNGRGKGSQAPALPAPAPVLASPAPAAPKEASPRAKAVARAIADEEKESIRTHGLGSEHPNFQGAHFSEEGGTSRVVPVAATSVLCLQRKEMFRRSMHKAPCVRCLLGCETVR